MSDYAIGFWNLENYFAPEGFPDRIDWLAQRLASSLEGWSEALFTRKTAQLATGIAGMNGGAGPDILGVCEVENRFVLEALCNALGQLLPGRAYAPVHVDNSQDRRGIDTAFIYDQNRFDIDPDTIFSHFVMRRTGTRDISQATFITQSGNELVLLSNHWPSRSGGGAEESAGFRMTAGETLAYWHKRIREVKGKDVAVIALGDLNDDPFDVSVTRHANASRVRGEITRSTSERFLNLTWNYAEQRMAHNGGRTRSVNGTLYFRGRPNLFDQILVSKGLLTSANPLTISPKSAKIDAIPAMVSPSAKEGPIRFGLPKKGDISKINQDGFSDHFPVSVTVSETD